jgi:hypothetical protein
MDILDQILSSLTAPWYAMASLTVVPMMLSIPRVVVLEFLILYALSGVWVIYCGIPVPKPKKAMVARMDDRATLFKQLKLQP